MKKLTAILLAVVMICSMALCTFAIELSEKPGQSGDVIIKTVTTKEDGQDARRYSVTIPADTDIAWEAESTTLTYTAEAHLCDGEKLTVAVTGNDVMTYASPSGNSYTLAYTLGGETAFAAESPIVFPAKDCDITVNIALGDWNTAVVGDYVDTLTFTAAIA